MNPETEFFTELIKLQHGLKVEKVLKNCAKKISWAKGWPNNKRAFWNAEAFMWQHKIAPETRKIIARELAFLKRKNLDLGCGAYSYIPSVGLDCAEKMLQFNENCYKKVSGDLESTLPFKEQEFASVTAIFVFNYVHNYNLLLKEINRVLKREGTFVMVLYSKRVNSWQKQQEENNFAQEKWKIILKKNGFKVKTYEKEGLWFFKCVKPKNNTSDY